MLDRYSSAKTQARTFELMAIDLPFSVDPQVGFRTLFAGCRHAYWLDSSKVEQGLSRYSFMGGDIGPYCNILKYRSSSEELQIELPFLSERKVVTADLFRFLTDAAELNDVRLPENYGYPFAGGYCGYFGYELKRQSCRVSMHEADTPDAALLFSDRFVAFDHQKERVTVCALFESVDEESQASAADWLQETKHRLQEAAAKKQTYEICEKVDQPAPVFDIRDDKQAYLSKISNCLDFIVAGESYEICLTNKISTSSKVDPLEIYVELRKSNPAPYAAFLSFDDLSVSCSSPERFLTVDNNRDVESKPIKGTSPRGATSEDDKKIIEVLRGDEKSRAENLMIVDLLRNDLGKVCKVGSIHVPSIMHVETYETVHQLVSTIRGSLADDVSIAECLKASFPGGSMTGVPKFRTLHIIDQLEGEARGIYSGSIGYISLSGECDLNIVIRTVVSRDDVHSIGCGGAIIALSEPNDEFDEILLKARAPMAAIVKVATGKDAESFLWKAGANESWRFKNRA